jgi:hypothetical protein
MIENVPKMQKKANNERNVKKINNCCIFSDQFENNVNNGGK